MPASLAALLLPLALLAAWPPPGAAVRLQRHGGLSESEGTVEGELATLQGAVDAALASAAAYPRDTKGLPAVRNAVLMQSVPGAFPRAVCVPRRALLREVPEDLDINAFRMPEAEVDPGACSPVMSIIKAAQFVQLAQSEEAPTICVFDHAVLGEEGNLCDGSACLLGQSWDPSRGMFNQTAVLLSHSKPMRNVVPGTSCSAEYGCTKDLGRLPEYDTVYSISQDHGWSFGHFMTGSLLRLLVGLDFLRGSGASARVHASANYDWALDAISALGVERSRIVLGDVRAKAALYAEDTHLARVGHKLASLSRWVLRRNIPTGMPLTSHKRPPVILLYERQIAEHGQTKRFMWNWGDLERAVREKFSDRFQIKVLQSEEMFNQTESWRLFATSAVVVSVHGGGLGNLLIMNPGAAVVEIMAASPGNPCGANVFQMTAARLGVQHYAVHQPGLSVDTMTFFADVPAVVRTVERAVQGVELSEV